MRTVALTLVALSWPVGSAVPEEHPAADQYGEPLPERALARLGTLRLRHAESVSAVSFSPDGRVLASTGYDGVVRLWETTSGRELGQLVGTTRPWLISVTYSPDGKHIGAVGDRIVQLWEVGAKELRWETSGHEGRISGIAFSPDGTTLATAGGDGTVRLWDVEAGLELMVFPTEAPRADAQPVAFSPDGTLLASGSRPGTIRVWNLTTGAEPVVIEKAHGREIASLVFMDDKTLASSGFQYKGTGEKTESGVPIVRAVGEIRVWDAETGKQVRELTKESEPAGQGVLAVTSDGETLVLLRRDAIEVWDFESGTVRRTIDGYHNNYGLRPHGVDLSPDGTTVAVQGPDNVIRLWNIATGEQVLDFADSHTSNVHAIATSPDGSTVATGDHRGAVYLWDRNGGCLRQRLRLGEYTVHALEFSPDGQTVAAGGVVREGKTGFDGAVELWNAVTGESVRRIKFDYRVAAATFAPDGKSLAVATWNGAYLGEGEPDNTIHLVDVASGDVQARLTGHTLRIVSLVFSPDGRQLASAAEDRTIRFWDVQESKEISRRDISEHHRRGIRSAVFAPDLSFAAAAALFESKIVVWDLRSGTPPAELDVPNLRGAVLALSPDRRLVAAGSIPVVKPSREFDQSIHLLDIQTGREVLKLGAPDGAINSLAFTPDGKRLISGMARGTALIWDIAEAYEHLDGPKGDRK